MNNEIDDTANLEIDPVEVDEWQKCSDDEDYPPSGATGNIYILVPQDTGAATLDVKPILQHLTSEFIAQSKADKEADQNPASLYIDIDGQYFPDYLMVAGLDLVSQRLLRYLEYKFALEPYEYNNVFLVSENGKRIENYTLLIPETIDCMINARYSHNGKLECFEVDETAIGSAAFSG